MPEAQHLQIPAAPHGGHPAGGLDFSVNSNPFGPNPVLLTAARAADVSHYPEAQHLSTRRVLANWHGLEPEQITLGVGVSELLYRLCRTYLTPGSQVISVGPAFGEFARACQVEGARLDTVNLEVGAALAALETSRPVLVYLCRPHNPLGTSWPLEEVRTLADACARLGALLILDEAYLPLAPDVQSLNHPAVIRLHSPGKAHGVVGLRLAYALSGERVTAELQNLAPAWAIPAPTLAALEALPQAQSWLDETLPRWQSEADWLAEQLTHLTKVQHAGLPFFLARLSAEQVKRLAERGFFMRGCTSYGLSGWARLSARQRKDNAALLAALKVAE